VETLIWSVHVLSAVVIITLILLQQGKGADMGAAFGSGASGSLFGASGSANFLSRMTALATAIFFITSLTLTYFSSENNIGSESVMQKMDIKSGVGVEHPENKSKAKAADNGEIGSSSKASEIPE